jgi:gliding motility-associated-like protein
VVDELCDAENGQIQINPIALNAEILWNDGSTDMTLSGKASGNYSFHLFVPGNDNCYTDSIIHIDKTNYSVPTDFSVSPVPLDSAGETYSVGFINLSSNVVSSSWSFGDGTISSDASPNHTYDYGNYIINLIVKDGNGCKGFMSKPLSLDLILDCALNLPDAFSPNADNMNDNLYLMGFAQEVELKIFNRWGEVIYFSNDLKDKWDGNYRKNPVPDGVYPYTLRYQCDGKQGNTTAGEILLIR